MEKEKTARALDRVPWALVFFSHYTAGKGTLANREFHASPHRDFCRPDAHCREMNTHGLTFWMSPRQDQDTLDLHSKGSKGFPMVFLEVTPEVTWLNTQYGELGICDAYARTRQ